MDIKVKTGSIQDTAADALVVNLFEGVELPAGATGAVDKALSGAISDVIRAGDFRGKPNELAVIYTRGAIPAPRVIVVGLGEVADFTTERIRRASAAAAKKARDLGCKSIASTAHGAGTGQVDPALAAQAIVEGAMLGLYKWTEHRNAPTERGPIETFTLVEFDAAKVAAIEAGAATGYAIGLGVNRTSWSMQDRTPRRSCSSAKASPSTPAASASSHRKAWMQ
jgi:leucyl aminopeptidase